MEEPPKVIEKRTGVYAIGAMLLIVFFIALGYFFVQTSRENITPSSGHPPENAGGQPGGELSENVSGQPDFRIIVVGGREIPVKKPASEEEDRAQVSTRIYVENLSPNTPPISLSWAPQPPGLEVEMIPSQANPPFYSDVYIRVYYDFPTMGPFEITIRGIATGTEIVRENKITIIVS